MERAAGEHEVESSGLAHLLAGSHFAGAEARPRPAPGGLDVISRSQAPLQIPSLDGLRAAFFVLVFLAHAGLENAWSWRRPAR